MTASRKGATAHLARTSPPFETATDAGRPDEGWLVHDDEARSFQVLDEALGDNRGHHLGGIMDTLAPAMSEGVSRYTRR